MYLNNHSNCSLRYGTISVDALPGYFRQLGADAMALTDINTTMGIPDFVKAAREQGIKPIAGCEFRNGDKLLYVTLARNREGFREINDWLTKHNLLEKEFPADAPGFSHAYVIYPFNTKKPEELRENEFTGIRPEEINMLFTSAYRSCQHKLVALLPFTFRDRSGWELHKSLRAISHNTLISKLMPGQYATLAEKPYVPGQVRTLFEAYPEILRNTKKITDDCSIGFDYGASKNKKVFSGSAYEDKILLEQLALEGMVYRYGPGNATAMERIRSELEIIFRLGFSSYFLVTWDIIRYSMSNGIYHIGRGSGANSIVAYCLRITDVDPIGLNLYFERFLNPRRSVPPDFDIDFSWRDREKIQAYLFSRYGKKHTALLGATSSFKGKSIFRELGKVFGLPRDEIDLLVSNPEKEGNSNSITRKICELSVQMAGFPSQRSIHAGGILISEEPVSYYTALDLPPKGFPTTQWDMYVAEELGYEKLDILSQRGIGHIYDTVKIIRENKGKDIDIHQADHFFHDEKVKERLRQGETNGCFYIESPAMRGLLKKLQCDDYLTLVAASSIIRPGVAQSGMMRQYIYRFHHPHDFEYLHPVMKEQLEETFGVMVYQEDVIKVAHHFAGLDLAEADVLRRAMSGKYRSRIEFGKIEEKFFTNCRQKGYPEQLAREVWRQIESFAGYSFSKAHSASYAVESFQSLFLKTYYPLEFMVGVINNFGGFFRSWVYFNEARRCGARIEVPCINHSRNETRIIGNVIYIGFVHVQNLEQQMVSRILEEREHNGPFCSLADFIARVTVPKEQLIILIRLGAFRFTKKEKAVLLWEGHLLLNKPAPKLKDRTFFPAQEREFSLPRLEGSSLRDAYDEIDLLGFPVSMNAFDMLQTRFRGEVLSSGMSRAVGKKVRMLGRLVAIKYARTTKGEMMNFGTFIDVTGEFFDTVHFPPSLKDYPFKGEGIYLLLGKIVEDFGFPSMETEKMAKMPFLSL